MSAAAQSIVVTLTTVGLLLACSAGSSRDEAAGPPSRSSTATPADPRPPAAAWNDPSAVLVYLVRARTAARDARLPVGTVLLDVDPVRWLPGTGRVGETAKRPGKIVNDTAELVSWPLSSHATFLGSTLLADGTPTPVRLDRQAFLRRLRDVVAAGHLVPTWLVRSPSGSRDVLLVEEQPS